MQLDSKTRPKSAKTEKKIKVKKEKGPFVELPPVELVLRYPIEVWMSCGEPFVKPLRKYLHVYMVKQITLFLLDSASKNMNIKHACHSFVIFFFCSPVQSQ